MELGTVIALAATIVALFAAVFTGIAAKAAWDQTKIQRQLRIDAAQPYVWIDVRGSESQGRMFELVLGNTGPTLAQNVRVTIEPPLPAGQTYEGSREVAQRRLANGISNLAPGRRVAWSIGIGWDILENENLPVHRVTVYADGPFGPVPPLEYVVDLNALREIRDDPPGSLHFVRTAIDAVAGRLPKHGRPFPVTVMPDGDDRV